MKPRTQPDGNSQPGEGQMGTVYLLHFEPAYKQAGRYLGWTAGDVLDRYEKHVTGRGSPLVKAAVEAGCAVVICRVWRGVDRHFERALKDQKNSQRLDPVANGQKTLAECLAEHHGC